MVHVEGDRHVRHVLLCLGLQQKPKNHSVVRKLQVHLEEAVAEANVVLGACQGIARGVGGSF